MTTGASHSWFANRESHALELVVPPAETRFAYIHKSPAGLFQWQAWVPFGGMKAFGEEKDLEVAKSKALSVAATVVWIEGVSKMPEVEAPKVSDEAPRGGKRKG